MTKHMDVIVPGKIVLGGEHAVLYGKPALAAPTTGELMVRASWEEHAEIHGWKIEESRGTYLLAHGATQPGTDVHPFIERAIRQGEQLAAMLLTAEGKTYNAEQIPNGTIRIVSGLPGRYGIGSSAAVAVACVELVARVILEAHQSAASAGMGLEKMANHVEDLVRKGQTGLDVAVSVRRKLIWFRDERPGPHLILPLEGVHPTFEKRFALLASGPAQETAAEMAEYARRKLGRGFYARKRLEQNETDVRKLEAALMTGDVTTVSETINRLSDWLISLGIVGKKARTILEVCAREKIPAKLCGTGGRSAGSGMILVLLPEGGWEVMTALAERVGCDRYPVLLPIKTGTNKVFAETKRPVESQNDTETSQVN